MVVLPYVGHHFAAGGCIADLVDQVVTRGTTRGLDTGCVTGLVPPVSPTR